MALVTAVLLLCAALVPVAGADDGKPVVTLAQKEAAKGAELTVSGTGWRPGALLMLLVCGQSSPGTGVIGGTNSCANADGRAVTTDAKGAFSKPVPVAAPPKPCPCVVHVATVTGEQAAVDAELTITGHPVASLPTQTDGGRLAVLTTPDLRGSDGLLTWFGAPPSRTLVLTVGNLGSAPVKDPVFQLGTSHGVFAPQWEDRQWKGTINPGQKAEVKLGFELSAGAHGDYQVSVKYAQKVLATQPWGVGRPWGVTLFWILLCLVVPAAVFRIGMAVVDKVRPSGAGHARRDRALLPVRIRSKRPARPDESAPQLNGTAPQPPAADPRSATATARLPWFTQDSAPTEKRPNTPTTKGNP
ncbi:hypothetical protein [Streptomyces sp. CBMA152]|uniref:hypothetical protein n=1 Tax=Streptomyces sp. CBMA152 TaxID=1896312 RepID=UPI00166151DB|nr:hypothetical protein [Streptomyces sp. CBMA152]MBD0746567.1 hypothetical protein [Streptomyces sp. CBMA152]